MTTTTWCRSRTTNRGAPTTRNGRRNIASWRTASTPGLNPARFSLGPLLTLEAAGAGVIVARCNGKNSKQMPAKRSCPCSRCRSVAGPVRSRRRSASGKNRGVNDPRLRSAKCAPGRVGSFTPRFRVPDAMSRASGPEARTDSGPVTVSFTAAVPGAKAASLQCSILLERTSRLKAPLAALAAAAALTRPAALQGAGNYQSDAGTWRATQLRAAPPERDFVGFRQSWQPARQPRR